MTQPHGCTGAPAPVPSSRNIVIFVDGTWQDGRRATDTNVRKLYKMLAPGTTGGVEQPAFYLPGVGRKPQASASTFEEEDFEVVLGHVRGELVDGLAGAARAAMGAGFGRGTAARIRSAYAFLCKHYRQGDKVFLFGFSRGAMAARSLAGFLEKVGLLLADRLSHVSRAYELYERGEDARQSELAAYLRRLTGRSFPGSEDPMYVPLHFLGLWDTVASLGVPSRLACLPLPFTEFVDRDKVPPNVMTARHALAIHELRGLFEPLPWNDGSHPDLKQVWFPGAHGDVGGGYADAESGLSGTALRWMAQEAQECGLVLKMPARAGVTPPPSVTVHHQVRGLFLQLLPQPRRWLEKMSQEDCLRFHFHESAREYVESHAPAKYPFRHPFVNAALKRADDLAVQGMLRLRLLGNPLLA